MKYLLQTLADRNLQIRKCCTAGHVRQTENDDKTQSRSAASRCVR